MAKHTLLLIDPEDQNRGVMEVSLRKVGYTIDTAQNAAQARQRVQKSAPDLIISEMNLPDASGLDLCEQFKSDPKLQNIPFIFLTSDASARSQALEIGADDFLAKPIYMSELKDRLEVALMKQQRHALEQGDDKRFIGRLEEMGLVDLLQVIDVSKRSGVLSIEHKGQQGEIWFRDGELLDAKMGHLTATDAINRILIWEDGKFDFNFTEPTVSRRINLGIKEVIDQGLPMVDKWSRMCEQLPALETIFRVDQGALRERDEDEPITPQISALISLFDGQRTMLDVINESPLGDLEALEGLTLLYFEGLIYEVKEVIGEEARDSLFIEGASEALDEPPAAPSESGTDLGFEMEIGDEPPPPSLDFGDEEPAPEDEAIFNDLYATISSPSSEDADLPPPIDNALDLPPPSSIEALTLLGAEPSQSDYRFDEAEDSFFQDLEDEPIYDAPAYVKKDNSNAGMLAAIIIIAVIGGGLGGFLLLRDRVVPIDPVGLSGQDSNWFRLDIDKVRPPLSMGIVAPINADWVTPTPEPTVSETTLNLSKKSKSKRKRGGSKKYKELYSDAKELYDEHTKQGYISAARRIDEAIAINSTSLEALYLGCLINLEIEDYSKVLDYASALKKLDHQFKDGKVYHLLGGAYQGLKSNQQAIAAYEDYLRLFPSAADKDFIRSLLDNMKRQ